jgi:hypothetical protein
MVSIAPYNGRVLAKQKRDTIRAAREGFYALQNTGLPRQDKRWRVFRSIRHTGMGDATPE